MTPRFSIWLLIPLMALIIWPFRYFVHRPGRHPDNSRIAEWHDTSSVDLEKKGTALVVGMYNLENFFDTIDEANDDAEFLPTSKGQWTSPRYQTKVSHMAKVIAAMNDGQSPDLLGLSEVENQLVLEDLIRDPQIAGRFQIVHYESPDARGIDVALLYKPDKFKVAASKPIRVTLPDDSTFKTRDILWVTGLVKGKDTLNVFVNHWPSRRGGEKESEPKREAAAKTLRTYVDALRQNPKSRIVIVGDFNDEPTNESISTVLGALPGLRDKCATCLYDPMFELKKQKLGSYFYDNGWDMIDQVIFTENLADKSYFKGDLSNVVIFQQDWMMFTDEKTGKSRPNRTYAGPIYKGGYSDHLPVYAKLVVR